MAALVSVNVRLRWDPEYKAEEIYPVTVAALKNIGEWWHREIMPGHFQPPAAAKYNYQPRTIGYMKSKARVKHHQRPLVWSGRFEASAKAAKTMRVTGKSRVTMRLSVWGGWETSRVHVRRELFSTTSEEQAQIIMSLRQALIGFMLNREGGMTFAGSNRTRYQMAKWAAKRGIA